MLDRCLKSATNYLTLSTCEPTTSQIENIYRITKSISAHKVTHTWISVRTRSTLCAATIRRSHHSLSYHCIRRLGNLVAGRLHFIIFVRPHSTGGNDICRWGSRQRTRQRRCVRRLPFEWMWIITEVRHGPKYYITGMSRYALSRWETSLHCNDVTHWMGACLD